MDKDRSRAQLRKIGTAPMVGQVLQTFVVRIGMATAATDTAGARFGGDRVADFAELGEAVCGLTVGGIAPG